MNEIQQLKKIAIQRRIDLIRMIYDAKTGHTGGSLSSVDILVALFYKILNIDAKKPEWEDRDRFILSKGHSVEGYYTVLADKGFFPKEELKTFSRYESRLTGHPNVKIPGVEMNTGALGHGLPAGIGMALAAKYKRKGYRVYVLMGDGEQAEGSVWEAAMSAGYYRLDNLIGIIDRNRLQISGNTEDIMGLEPLKDKWSSFRWEVLEVDGNDIEQLIKVFESIPLIGEKPHLIIANTTKGKGISFTENEPGWHHGVPDEEQYKQAMAELNQQLQEVN
jgi:transketolase